MTYQELVRNIYVVFDFLLEHYKVIESDNTIVLASNEREFFIRFTLKSSNQLTVNYGLTYSKMTENHNFNQTCFSLVGEALKFDDGFGVKELLKIRDFIESSNYDELHGVQLVDRIISLGFDKRKIVVMNDNSPDYQSVVIFFNQYGIEITRNLWFVDYYLLSSFGKLNAEKNKLIDYFPLSSLLKHIFSDFDEKQVVYPDPKSLSYLCLYISKLMVYCATENIEKIMDHFLIPS